MHTVDLLVILGVLVVVVGLQRQFGAAVDTPKASAVEEGVIFKWSNFIRWIDCLTAPQTVAVHVVSLKHDGHCCHCAQCALSLDVVSIEARDDTSPGRQVEIGLWSYRPPTLAVVVLYTPLHHRLYCRCHLKYVRAI